MIIGMAGEKGSTSKDLIAEFDMAISRAVSLIESDPLAAKNFFNNHIVPKFKGKVYSGTGPFIYFRIFFIQLDEYFNNEGSKIIGQVTKDSILKSYYSDYKDDLEKANNPE